MSSETPLVTCLCLTMPGRAEFLTRAIQCYCHQTYENKELLILPDSIIELSARAIGGIPRGRNINALICAPSKGRTIGQKRNFGCESAQGEIIALFDDDDFSAPERIVSQVESLKVSRKAVTGYQIMKFTDGASWWQYTAAPGHVVGSSLCFRRDWWAARGVNPKYPASEFYPNRFPEVQIGEDAAFCETAHRAGQLAMCPDSSLMYATIHKGNSSPRKPGGPEWRELPEFKWQSPGK